MTLWRTTFNSPRKYVSRSDASCLLAGEPVIDHGLSGQLDGGTETEFCDQIRAGGTLSVGNRITDLEVRESTTPGKMLMMSSESISTNQHSGECIAIQRRQWMVH